MRYAEFAFVSVAMWLIATSFVIGVIGVWRADK